MRVAKALALAIMIAACDPTPPFSPPASEGAASIPPTSAPTISAAPTSELAGWRKVATTDAMGDGPAAVVWFKDRWVALGVERPGARWHPLAWWSTDGEEWTAGQLGEVPSGGVTSVLVGLAVLGDLLVAVGWSSSGVDQGATVDLARAAGDSTGGNSAAGDSVVGTETAGHVTAALGSGRSNATLAIECVPSLRSANALVMTSPDGVTWTTVPAQTSLAGQPMLGVVVRDGTLVAVGGADGTKRSATWTSSDGRTWTRAPDSAALRAGAMQGIIAVGETLVAWGFYLDEEICPAPMLWRSTDGVAWSLLSDTVGLQSLWRSASTAATATTGVTVVGSYTGRGIGLATTDGATWAAHDLPEDLNYGPIIGLPGGFLAGGAQSVWFSSDGVDWKVVSTPRVQFSLLGASPGSAIGLGKAANAGSDPFVKGTDVWLGPLPGQ